MFTGFVCYSKYARIINVVNVLYFILCTSPFEDRLIYICLKEFRMYIHRMYIHVCTCTCFYIVHTC